MLCGAAYASISQTEHPIPSPDDIGFLWSMIPIIQTPETVRTWFTKRQYLLDMGVDGFKTDGGEFIYRPDVRFCDGSDGKSGKNRYARDYTCAYRDFIGSQRVLFSRAGFSGSILSRCTGAAISNHRTQNCEASFTPGFGRGIRYSVLGL